MFIFFQRYFSGLRPYIDTYVFFPFVLYVIVGWYFGGFRRLHVPLKMNSAPKCRDRVREHSLTFSQPTQPGLIC